MAKDSGEPDPVIIKKYANRRLYNTARSAYVTLDDLCAMVKDGIDFVVQDARSGEDLTRSVLTQIIFEQETRGANLLPVRFLRQLIGYYDDGLRALVPSYLEVAMDNFSGHQQQMRRNLESGFGELFPLHTMKELGEQNMAMFQQALSMFSPFAPGKPQDAPGNGARPAAPEAEAKTSELDEMRAQLARMQAQLDALSRQD